MRPGTSSKRSGRNPRRTTPAFHARFRFFVQFGSDRCGSCVRSERWGAVRCSCVAAKADVAAKSEWTRGDGANYSHGSNCGSSFRSALCSVSSTAERVVASGRPPALELSCGAPPLQPVSATGRPAPAAARACRRNGSRRRSARGHPAPARPQQPGITSIYLQGIDKAEITESVHTRRAPMLPVSTSLRL